MKPFRPIAIAAALMLPTFSIAQDTAGHAARTVDLNDQVVQASGLQNVRKKSRITHTSLVFRPDSTGLRRSWDSAYLLTRFPSPAARRFKLVTVSGRVKEFDTSMIDVNLVVLQINGADTMLREIPLRANSVRSGRQKLEIALSKHQIYLQPSEFYLGYSFRTNVISKELVYRLYATSGGEGVFLTRRNGKWVFYSGGSMPNVFPFTISFLEG